MKLREEVRGSDWGNFEDQGGGVSGWGGAGGAEEEDLEVEEEAVVVEEEEVAVERGWRGLWLKFTLQN